MTGKLLVLLGLLATAASSAATAQVLGPCGTPDADKPAAALKAPSPGPEAQDVSVSRVPLPGEKAPNFQLPAVVGDEVKTIKLSDYHGKWRVLCFYPADFTFV